MKAYNVFVLLSAFLVASLILTACPPPTPAVVEKVVKETVVVEKVVEATPVPDLLDEILAAGKMVMSSDPNYAPQSFLNEAGEMDGFDIDVGKEVARRLGVQLEIVTPDWDMITAGNWGGRWDISIGSMTITEERSKVLWFTVPYYFTPAQFAVHVDNTDIQTLDDLAGKRIGVGTETTYEQWLNKTLTIVGEKVTYATWEAGEVRPYPTDANAIEDLSLGDGVRLDAVFSAKPTLLEAIKTGVPIKLIGDPVYYEPLAFALDKARGPSDKFLAKLNEILAVMHMDGTLTTLSMKWYNTDLTKKALVVPEE